MANSRPLKFRAWDTYGKHIVDSKQFAELLSVKEYARKPEPQKRLKHVQHSVLVKKGKGLFGIDEYADILDTKIQTIEMEAKKFSANPFTDEDLILMQYTGLTDRHDVDIYEGDIVQLDLHFVGDKTIQPCTGVIAFEEAEFFVDQTSPYAEHNLAYHTLNNQLEVIGNIYENPPTPIDKEQADE